MENELLMHAPHVIEGIGPARAQALEAGGVKTFADMLSRGPRAVYNMLSGISPKQVSNWYVAIQLMLVDGVTPDVAEALIEGEVYSIERLADMGLQTFERIIARGSDEGKIKDVPSIYGLAAIQREAAKSKDTGFIIGKVLLAEDSLPFSGITVSAERMKTITDEQGFFGFSGLPLRKIKICFELPEIKRIPVFTKCLPGPYVPMNLYKFPSIPEAAPPRVVDEANGGFVWLSKDSTLKWADRNLDEIPEDALLQVRHFYQEDRVRLIHLSKKKVGDELVCERVYLKKDQVPTAQIGSILRYRNGVLTETGLRLEDVAHQQIKKLLKIDVAPKRLHQVRTATI
jgi:hypothetical protein